MGGFAKGCPLRAALNAARHDQEIERAATVLRTQSTIVEDDADAERWRTPYGHYWIPRRALSMQSLFEMLAERSAAVYGGECHGVRKGDVVLDCGSNIGTFVAEAIERGAERVVACEPSPIALPLIASQRESWPYLSMALPRLANDTPYS